jgi:GT2 family glycosyltransferase
VVVVDNESDGSLRKALSPLLSRGNLHLIEQDENLGFSAGMNCGLEYALTLAPSLPIVAINNDAHFAGANSLFELVSGLKAIDEPAIVAPRIVLPDGTASSTGGQLRFGTMKTSDLAADGVDLDFLTWACIAVSPEVFMRIGLLSERFFMYWEDVEFGVRARRAAIPMRVIPVAEVVHSVSASHAKAGAKIEMYSALGMVSFARSVGPRAFPGLIIRASGRIVRTLFAKDVRALRAVLQGIKVGLSLKGAESAFEALRKQDLLSPKHSEIDERR